MVNDDDSTQPSLDVEPGAHDEQSDELYHTPSTLRGTSHQRAPRTTKTTRDTIALPNIGEVLNDIYEIRSILGEGGMGRVYEGHDRLLNRAVAIKIAWSDAGSDSLHREAQAMAALRGRGLPGVYAIGQHRGIDYYVMERLHGDTLSTFIKHGGPESQLSIGEALDILAGVADALASVHGAGLIHRDLKPSNIMLAPDNYVVLLDFGVFRTESESSDPSMLYGSPRYVAPEAIEKKVRVGQAHLLDIYSLGVIAFELITGQPPFAAKRVSEVLIKHLTQPAPTLETLRPCAPLQLDRLIQDMLAKEPDERPFSAEAVASRLRALKGALDEPSEPPMTALIVEDTPHMRMFLEACVKYAIPRVHLVTASSGGHALALVKEHAPRLLLLDLQVHDMSALELCMSLRGTGSTQGMTMVAIGAHTTEGDRKLLRKFGVADFIATNQPGPELMAELTALLKQIARRKR